MLADLLAEHRIGAIEATALLQRVVEEVDMPLFAFDPKHFGLVNPPAKDFCSRLLDCSAGRPRDRIEIMSLRRECLGALHFNSRRALVLTTKLVSGRGVPHTLVVLSDVSRALREEERWPGSA